MNDDNSQNILNPHKCLSITNTHTQKTFESSSSFKQPLKSKSPIQIKIFHICRFLEHY